MYAIDLDSADGLRLEATVHEAKESRRVGTVVAAHDLGMDMDEGGMFLRLAERLAQAGLTTVRFSFRGHGGSDGDQRSCTIEGEVLDITAAVMVALAGHSAPLYLVASGFGAVATCLALPSLDGHPRGLVLWQPVLDLQKTFVRPLLPWGRANLGESARRALRVDDFVKVDGEFELGRGLYEEMRRLDPVRPLLACRTPTLIVHGDRDELASHDVSAKLAAARSRCEFHTIPGAEHGFATKSHEDDVLEVTARWLLKRSTAVGEISHG